MSGNDRVGPHRGRIEEIVKTMAAHSQAFGFDDGNFRGRETGHKHHLISDNFKIAGRDRSSPPACCIFFHLHLLSS
jgi:hypothetical protein